MLVVDWREREVVVGSCRLIMNAYCPFWASNDHCNIFGCSSIDTSSVRMSSLKVNQFWVLTGLWPEKALSAVNVSEFKKNLSSCLHLLHLHFSLCWTFCRKCQKLPAFHGDPLWLPSIGFNSGRNCCATGYSRMRGAFHPGRKSRSSVPAWRTVGKCASLLCP